MAKITRVTQKIFGSSAGLDQIGKFGSLAAGTPAFTTDPAVIQSLSNYLTGWFGAVLGDNSPAIEDMNALCYLFAYQIAYAMQEGVPEWDSGTTYYTGSLASSAGIVYASIVDNNTNNALTDLTKWAPLRLKQSIKTVTASTYTILLTDECVEFDCSSNSIVATLPSLASSKGLLFSFDRVDTSTTHTLTVSRAGSDLIENGATSYILDVPFQSQDFFGGTSFWKVRG